MHLVIAGIHTRPAVASAKRAGHEVTAVDYFGDVDLKLLADRCMSVVRQEPYRSSGRIAGGYSDQKLISLAGDIKSDGVLLTSTMELKHGRVIGNEPGELKRLKNKVYQLEKIKAMDVRTPSTEFVNSREEAVKALKKFSPPVVMKPACGGGGRGVALVRSGGEVSEIEEEHLIQEFIPGRPFSVSTLSTGGESMALSSSLQILGSRLVNASGFTYCGSVVPHRAPPEAETLAEEISLEFGLKGWNGIDFVESNGKLYFIEVNPRFQGTLDAIERACPINIVEAHLKACDGELIGKPGARRYAARLTLFARQKCIVRRSMLGYTCDVPLENSIIEEGEPITTVVGMGKNGTEALNRAKERVRWAYSQVGEARRYRPASQAPWSRSVS